MAKKKYRVSSKPKVSGMNEYIYNTLKDDLAKEYKVNRPGKPKKLKYAKGMTTRQMTAADKVYDKFIRQGGKRGAFTYIGSNKPLKNVTPKGFAVGDKNYTIKKGYAPPPDYEAPSQKPVTKQRIKGEFKPTNKKIRVKEGRKMVSKVASSYEPKLDPLKGYGGKFSPLNKKVIQAASKPLSKSAKRALVTRGAKVAAKGVTRLIPGVGTALLAKDVYDVTKWAMKQPKRDVQDYKLYGVSTKKRKRKK